MVIVIIRIFSFQTGTAFQVGSGEDWNFGVSDYNEDKCTRFYTV